MGNFSVKLRSKLWLRACSFSVEDCFLFFLWHCMEDINVNIWCATTFADFFFQIYLLEVVLSLTFIPVTPPAHVHSPRSSFFPCSWQLHIQHPLSDISTLPNLQPLFYRRGSELLLAVIPICHSTTHLTAVSLSSHVLHHPHICVLTCHSCPLPSLIDIYTSSCIKAPNHVICLYKHLWKIIILKSSLNLSWVV